MRWGISVILLLFVSCGGGDFPPMDNIPSLWKVRGDSMCRNVQKDYPGNGHDCFYIDEYPEQEKYFECFWLTCESKKKQMQDEYSCMSDTDLLGLFGYINELQNSCKEWEDNKENWMMNLKLWKSTQIK